MRDLSRTVCDTDLDDTSDHVACWGQECHYFSKRWRMIRWMKNLQTYIEWNLILGFGSVVMGYNTEETASYYLSSHIATTHNVNFTMTS